MLLLERDWKALFTTTVINLVSSRPFCSAMIYLVSDGELLYSHCYPSIMLLLINIQLCLCPVTRVSGNGQLSLNMNAVQLVAWSLQVTVSANTFKQP